ncbi:flavodoxin [Methylomagnum sp.]
MSKIGIFFGTDTGTTRLIAKRIYKVLGEDIAAKPQNVNRATPEEFMRYDALILGTPSYGIGDIPGLAVGCVEPNWAEFLPRLDEADFTGKRIALFGLGHQERYSERFASSLIQLYRFFYGHGADIVGRWSTEGYQFQHSDSIIDGQFVGLVVDQRSQPFLSDERIATWLTQIKPLLLERG